MAVTPPRHDVVMFIAGGVREREIEQIESDLAEVCGHLHALHARMVRLAAEAVTHGWWEQGGVRSPEHWLCWQTGLSPQHATQVVAAARRRHELPVTMAAFDAGELSLDQISPIVSRAPAWADRQACDLARSCTVSQLRVAVGRYPFEDDRVPGAPSPAPPSPEASSPSPVPEASSPQPASHGGVTDHDGDPDPHSSGPEASPGHEFVSLVCGDDGVWRLTGRLDADHGLLVDAALREARDALSREHGVAATGVDALVEIAGRSLGTLTEWSRRDRFRVHVLLDERRQLVDPFGHCLPAWIRDLITCDATASVTWTRHGVPIAQGSTSDDIPSAIRRYVLARDQGCRVPGCRARRFDLHHVIHREDRGTNDPSNLASLCPRHHRMHHRGLLGIDGDAETPDGLVVTDQHGRIVTVNGLIRPPTGPPPAPSGCYEHPSGEVLDTRWLHFRPPPPSTAA